MTHQIRSPPASLVVLAPDPHSAVGADGGAPAVHADAPDSVVLADGGAPAAHDPWNVLVKEGPGAIPGWLLTERWFGTTTGKVTLNPLAIRDHHHEISDPESDSPLPVFLLYLWASRCNLVGIQPIQPRLRLGCIAALPRLRRKGTCSPVPRAAWPVSVLLCKRPWPLTCAKHGNTKVL